MSRGHPRPPVEASDEASLDLVTGTSRASGGGANLFAGLGLGPPDPITGLPMGGPGGVGGSAPNAVEFIDVRTAAIASRKRERKTLEKQLQTDVKEIGLMQKRCILCSFGSRAIDASDTGSKLYAELLRIIEMRHTSTHPVVLVDMIRRFYDGHIRSIYSACTPPIEVPPFDGPSVYEHLTTIRHTLNPRIFISSRLRFLDDILEPLSQRMIAADGGVDLRVTDRVLRIISQMGDTMQMNPGKLAFASENPDDIHPDVVAYFSTRSAAQKAAKEFQPSTIDFFESLDNTDDLHDTAAPVL